MQGLQSAESIAGGITGTSIIFTATDPIQTLPPVQPPPLKCPRCDSTNTKFCYYNNYNLSQPRHFCKACRRYWTKGGVLRNVPVGGGCRKTKRSSSSSKSSKSSSKRNCNKSTAASRSTTSDTSTVTSVAPPSTHDPMDPMHVQVLLDDQPNDQADDLLPVFQSQFQFGSEWSLSLDHNLFDLPAAAGDTGSIWNQLNWSDAVPDPALYLP